MFGARIFSLAAAQHAMLTALLALLGGGTLLGRQESTPHMQLWIASYACFENWLLPRMHDDNGDGRGLAPTGRLLSGRFFYLVMGPISMQNVSRWILLGHYF
jgi:hypothetical protein